MIINKDKFKNIVLYILAMITFLSYIFTGDFEKSLEFGLIVSGLFYFGSFILMLVFIIKHK